jgi:Leucine-rich repeat (LRR) protein
MDNDLFAYDSYSSEAASPSSKEEWCNQTILLWRDADPIYTTPPSQIFLLINLEELHFNNSFLTTIPAEIGNLTNLTYLGIEKNYYLTTIPAEIGNLTNLTTLFFYQNRSITTIPKEI